MIRIRIDPDWNVKVSRVLTVGFFTQIRIEPDWNVKFCTQLFKGSRTLIRIEPDWNVKRSKHIITLTKSELE